MYATVVQISLALKPKDSSSNQKLEHSLDTNLIL